MSKVFLTDSAKLERLRDIMRPVISYFKYLHEGRDYSFDGKIKKAQQSIDRMVKVEEAVEQYLPEIQALIFGGETPEINPLWTMVCLEDIAKYHAIGLCGLHQHNGVPLTKEIVEEYFKLARLDIANGSIKKSVREYDKIVK